MYLEGTSVQQDSAEAVKWLKLAADQGDAMAQSHLGTAYLNGTGVRQNSTEAKEWFGKACDNGLQIGCDMYKSLNKVLSH